MEIIFISSVFITLLFFLSGFNKIKGFISTAKGLSNRTNFPLALAKIVIVCVIILEIVAPFIISLYAYTHTPFLRGYARLSIIGLIIFTILATILYHFPPQGKNLYSCMSNLSTIGGLMLLYKYCL
jgi:uncharacterized membrane protein YphA (DoxX/SURF4 family)